MIAAASDNKGVFSRVIFENGAGMGTTWICWQESVSCFGTLKVAPDTWPRVIQSLIQDWKARGG